MNQVNEQERKKYTNHKLIVMELKAKEFMEKGYGVKSDYSVYKGRLIGTYSGYQEKLTDFLIEMEELDFTNKEVNDFLVERYWNDEEE